LKEITAKMKKTVLTAIVLILFVFGKAQTNYFVSLTGNNNNSGLSETNAWRTINYATSSSSPVMAGDTVFIKAGNYGNENIVVEKNGTESNPITIQGYQTIPGDNPDLNYSYGDNLDASVMPLIDGGDRTTGEGININGSANITIQNIQITNYEAGIYTWSASSTNLILDNIIVMGIGDINASYSGLGIGIVYADNNIVRNCIVVNSCAEGISLVANNNLIENCEVYCDEDMTEDASTDYYIVAEGNNNIFRECYIERVGSLEHVGHGMGLKGNCENNLFEDCVAKDMEGGGFYVRHRGAKFNEFRNCTAIGTIEEICGFLIRDGASYNIFNNCYSDNCAIGIMFFDTEEDGGAHYCGRHNVFNNCIINKPVWAIDFLDYSLPSPADSNLFANCVFNSGTYLFETLRENYDNEMVNCIVSDFQTLNTGTEPLTFGYSFSDFYNNGFPIPAGTGNISDNPLFVDALTNNFHLQSESPCIDVGTASNAPVFDFEGTTRPQGAGFDIGAFEHTGSMGIANNNWDEIAIFPNPAKNEVHFSEDFTNYYYGIISLSGIVQKSGIIDSNSIVLNELNPGFYFIKIHKKESDKIRVTKIIKE
jgi:hypothetical protein